MSAPAPVSLTNTSQFSRTIGRTRPSSLSIVRRKKTVSVQAPVARSSRRRPVFGVVTYCTPQDSGAGCASTSIAVQPHVPLLPLLARKTDPPRPPGKLPL